MLIKLLVLTGAHEQNIPGILNGFRYGLHLVVKPDHRHYITVVYICDHVLLKRTLAGAHLFSTGLRDVRRLRVQP